MIYALLATLLVVGVHCNGPLPNYMIGEYVLETSEGFDNYMYEIGVSWFTRKVFIIVFYSVFFFKTVLSLDSLQPVPHC